METQPCQVGEVSQLRRYLTAQLVFVEAQIFQVGEVSQLRRYLTAQLVLVETQPFQYVRRSETGCTNRNLGVWAEAGLERLPARPFSRTGKHAARPVKTGAK